jgi:8-amino-7-oxononanoate synthase
VGTLGKAFGAAGAFVAGSRTLVQWLWNRARSFVFSTGASPVVARAALTSLKAIANDEGPRKRLHENAMLFRHSLSNVGLQPRGYGPIVPVVVGDPGAAVQIANALRGAGMHVQPVRPPTVPGGSARLRLTTTARHSAADIEAALAVIKGTLPWPRPSS